jgi:pimeloyl-ACP methyl ester carboxylesterase
MEMHSNLIARRLPGAIMIAAALALAALVTAGPGLAQSASPGSGTLPNVVLVHGAWADGSSWSGVIERLQTDGYHVTAVQLPLTGVDADAAVVREVLAAQSGPTILVGHSYGGAVITALGTDAPNVVGLVYVAAFAPDEGETLKALTSAGTPPAGVAAIRPDAQGNLWLDPDGFVEYFAPDLDPMEARMLAAVQHPIAASAFQSDQPFGPPTWKTVPSWYLVATDDQMIPPDAERFFAQRMGATTSEIASSHVAMLSHPDVVAQLIETAAAGAGKP